ncbi:MAG: metal ABC transporter ATP-binding protein [Burkholderiales bacterium]
MLDFALHLDNLTISHYRHPVVHHLSGSVPRGSLTAVIGPNGAGKSSLLEALVGRVPTATGTLTIAPDLSDNIGYLPQQTLVDRNFPVRVLDAVQMGSWRLLGSFRAASSTLRVQAQQALATVGLHHFENRFMGELSVGQFQRALFARLLLQNAPLILLDEPFNAIDSRTCEDLLQVVSQWRKEGRTVLAVLHDMNQVSEYFDQTLLLAREPIAWGLTQDVLTPENLLRARQISTHWDENAAHCFRPAGLPQVQAAQGLALPLTEAP